MPSYLSSDLIREIRYRKHWTQSQLIKQYNMSEINLSRIENRHQKPRTQTLSYLMGALEIPLESFFSPYLENQTLNMLQMREAVSYYLSFIDEIPNAAAKTEELLTQMEDSGDFSHGINRQYVLSSRAALREARNKEPIETMRIIDEGIAITFPEYTDNIFNGEMLIFEEIKLLHTKAQTYIRAGEANLAIALLDRILSGLEILPLDDYDKERMLTPLMLSLVRARMIIGDMQKAKDLCDAGIEIANSRNKGFYAPEFAFQKACCSQSLRQYDKVKTLINQAYFGYVLLRRYNKANQIKQYAQNVFNIHIETYGTESLDNPIPAPNFGHGKHVICNSIGELIAMLRTEAGLTLRELAEGICSINNLASIEKGVVQGNVYHLEAIMERLGRHIDKYFNTFLSAEEFQEKQNRDSLNALLANKEYDKAVELISKLKHSSLYSTGVNKQFLDCAAAEMYGYTDGYTSEHLSLLLRVIKTNESSFDIGKIAYSRLTHNEIIAINQIGNHLCGTGDIHKGLRVFESLKESMDRFIVDEGEKIRMYTTVMYNYSKFLGSSKRYDEAMKIIELAEELCIKHNRLRVLPGLALNRGCNLNDMGFANESLTYLAQAYYGSILINRDYNAEATKSYVKDNFNIDFDFV